MTSRELLDPTGELEPAARTLTPRPALLEGLTIGLLDIAKARGDVFLDRLHELLAARGMRGVRFSKPTFTKVIPPDLLREVSARADLVVEALAD